MGISLEIEEGSLGEYDEIEAEDDTLTGYLAGTYFNETQEGIRKRRARNEEIEKDLDEEERHMREAWLGYTFTFDRQCFWTYLGDVPEGLKRSFIAFGLKHPHSSDRSSLTRARFEELFYR